MYNLFTYTCTPTHPVICQGYNEPETQTVGMAVWKSGECIPDWYDTRLAHPCPKVEEADRAGIYQCLPRQRMVVYQL